MPVVAPYTVTNSFKGGFFMRTYSRNVRRAWDGEDHHAPKRQRLNDSNRPFHASYPTLSVPEAVRNAIDLEDNLERAIRETSVAALSSSPSRKNSTIFSLAESQEDENRSGSITPPSSPLRTLQVTPPNIKARKPTFSCMDKKKKEKEKEKHKLKAGKRKLDAIAPSSSDAPAQRGNDFEQPLSEIHNSSCCASSMSVSVSGIPDALTPNSHTAPTALPQTRPLIQTILDYGPPVRPITCAACDMSYTPTHQQDVQFHNMYHHRHSAGIELGKPFVKAAMRWCYEVAHIPGSVVVVDRKISIPGRKTVQRVLEVVNRELGSVDIPEEELWSQRVLEASDEEGEQGEQGKKVDRYKVFLHVIENKCVGVCLAERITKAYNVISKTTADSVTTTSKEDATTKGDSPPTPAPSTSPQSSAELTLSPTSAPAVVGVSRIWTSASFRRKGIANNLLDCVVNQFIYGFGMERGDVAFSQPTELGVRLARGWFGEDDEWAVYKEE